MGKQYTFYRIKWGRRNQQCTQKSKNAFNSSNIRDAQKPASIHGKFYINGLIFLHSKIGEIIFLSVKSLSSKGTTPFIKALGGKKKIWYKRFQDNGILWRQQVQYKNIRNVLTDWFTAYECKKWTCWNNWMVNMYNQGVFNRNVPQNTIQEIQKLNDKVTNRGSSILNEKVPFQI